MTTRSSRTDTERLDWLEAQKPELIGAGIYLHNDAYWSRHESDDETLDRSHRGELGGDD